MNQLRRRALARLARTAAEVQNLYDGGCPLGTPINNCLRDLCESHERLRAELQGAKVLLKDARREVASVVRIMDNLTATWGDADLFRRCRDRLRDLLPDKEGC